MDNEDANAAEILRGLYEQRARLGLVRELGFPLNLKTPIELHPVVAISGDLSKESLRRLKIVAERLAAVGHEIDYRRVNLVGRMDPLDLA